MGDRSTYRGKRTETAEALSSVATSKSFIVYDECEKVEDAVVDAELIARSHAVLEALRQLQPSLSFPKVAMQSAVAWLFDANAAKRGVQPAHKADWVITITRRLRNIVRVVHQGELKGKAPWAKALPWAAARSSLAPAKTPEFLLRRQACVASLRRSARAEGFELAH